MKLWVLSPPLGPSTWVVGQHDQEFQLILNDMVSLRSRWTGYMRPVWKKRTKPHIKKFWHRVKFPDLGTWPLRSEEWAIMMVPREKIQSQLHRAEEGRMRVSGKVRKTWHQWSLKLNGMREGTGAMKLSLKAWCTLSKTWNQLKTIIIFSIRR